MSDFLHQPKLQKFIKMKPHIDECKSLSIMYRLLSLCMMKKLRNTERIITQCGAETKNVAFRE